MRFLFLFLGCFFGFVGLDFFCFCFLDLAVGVAGEGGGQDVATAGEGRRSGEEEGGGAKLSFHFSSILK